MDYGDFNPLRKGRDLPAREIKVGTVKGINLMCHGRREEEGGRRSASASN